MALANLGVAAHGQGDFDVARERHEWSLAACRANGYAFGIVRSLRDLGDVARDQGDYAASLGFYRECLERLGDRGDLRVVVDALDGAALAAAAWNQPARAARLLGAAQVLATWTETAAAGARSRIDRAQARALTPAAALACSSRVPHVRRHAWTTVACGKFRHRTENNLWNEFREWPR